jgi:hypothetical protein
LWGSTRSSDQLDSESSFATTALISSMDLSTSEGSQRLSTTFLASSNLPTYKIWLSDVNNDLE